MSFATWSLFVGVLLITMVLVGTLLDRLPLSSAMIYLGLGYAIGPGGIGVLTPDPFLYAGALELITEVALLISLFAVGLKLGIPLTDRRWRLPLRLAFPSMVLTVGLIAAVGYWGIGLSLGAAVLLGGILAPTDPVLAAGVPSEPGANPDRVGFSLAGEGALNDGSAFPFVLLGLGLMGLHDIGAGGWRWWAVDLLWSTGGGLVIGAALGVMVGQLVVYLRTRHQNAVGFDEFLSLGLVATAYGVAQLVLASGFLAVFAAGLALNRVREQPLVGTVSHDVAASIKEDWMTHSHHASSAMTRAVQGFNHQLEKLAELGIVLLIGALLPYATLSATLWWFIPLLFLVIRPLAVFAGTLGGALSWRPRAMMAWFGIRGIGSVFYLMYALFHGVSGPLAEQLVALTMGTVVASIIVHGVSVLPLMNWYLGTPRGKRDAR
ncbi:MAG TPA: sodium:proton antiporter [Rhodocyclaceae bacterium]|nr:sodium:proton antiporter [Rhodocyclaceae bacterium]